MLTDAYVLHHFVDVINNMHKFLSMYTCMYLRTYICM